jgi:hypothetical protein
MHNYERATLFIDRRWSAPAAGDVIEAVGVKPPNTGTVSSRCHGRARPQQPRRSCRCGR